MPKHNGVVEYQNVYTGKKETPVETLKVIDNMIANGQTEHALYLIDGLWSLAEQLNDITLIESLQIRKKQIKFPFKFFAYRQNGAADDINTRPETKRLLPPGTPVIFKPNLNPDKIYEDLFIIQNEEKSVSGIPFWFVVHNFFECIDWLEVTMDSKFIAWVRNCFGWEWNRKDFKRINPRFKMHFEDWPDWNKTDKSYCCLIANLRNTYQQQKPNGQWEDKEIYYKENKLRYNF